MFLFVLLFAGAGSLHAQLAVPGVTQDQIQQQRRIRQGARSGALTRRELRHLHAQQAQIQHAKRIARADGRVTAGERARISARQRHASRSIRRQKHDWQQRF